MPQAIETAPKDGTVILTNAGICRWWESRYHKTTGWVACDISDSIYQCREEGMYYLQPTLWEHIPKWITDNTAE